MNAVVTSLDHTQPSHSSAFQTVLTGDALRTRVPAVYAPGAHERTSSSYTFISTERVLDALGSVGFVPVEARQAARARSPLHARHLIRLRRRCEAVHLRDSIPGDSNGGGGGGGGGRELASAAQPDQMPRMQRTSRPRRLPRLNRRTQQSPAHRVPAQWK